MYKWIVLLHHIQTCTSIHTSRGLQTMQFLQFFKIISIHLTSWQLNFISTDTTLSLLITTRHCTLGTTLVSSQRVARQPPLSGIRYTIFFAQNSRLLDIGSFFLLWTQIRNVEIVMYDPYCTHIWHMDLPCSFGENFTTITQRVLAKSKKKCLHHSPDHHMEE